MTLDASSPPPPFRFSRESRIRIDREGRFWHEGDLIEHAGLARALASWVAIDPESDRYILRNSMDWCFITVDDAPLVVRAVHWTEQHTVLLHISDGTIEPLHTSTLRIDPHDVPYCDVHTPPIPARFSRDAAFALLEHAEPADNDAWQLVMGNTSIPLNRVALGAPRRLPANPPT